MRTLLVDDEEPARDRLRTLLAEVEDVDVVGEAADGVDALQKIGELQPDLVFLDVQMPGCTGLEVAASLASPRPNIVFCTAFDSYAVDAFELHAIDYLLKPVNRMRLGRALARARERPAGSTDAAIEAATRSTGKHPTRFLAKRANRFCVVPIDEVLYFASEGGLTRLQTADNHYWMDPTLADLEQRLDPHRFFRVSRAALVDLDAVREVRPLDGGQGRITLRNGATVDVSRRRFRDLMDRLAQL